MATKEPATDVEESDHLSSVDELNVIVDSDAHVQEQLGTLLPYIDDEYSGAKELIQASKVPLTDIYTSAVGSPSFVYNTLGDEEESIADTEKTGDDLIDLMDELNVHAAVVEPTLNLMLPTVNNSRFAVALANAYNTWIVEEVDDYHNIKASMLVAPHKPDMAAEEIDRMASEDSIVGVQLPGGDLTPPPGHEWYNPIYEAAQTHDLPIAMHSSGGSNMFPNHMKWAESYAINHTWDHPLTHVFNLTSMLFEGVPERYPDLEFHMQEGGLAIFAFLITRLDDQYLQFKYEIPALEKLPSEYIHDQFYFSSQPVGHTPRNPDHLAWLIDIVGPESVMWSGDIPHHDFDTPAELFDRINTFFDEDTVRGIMGETAAGLYDLEV